MTSLFYKLRIWLLVRKLPRSAREHFLHPSKGPFNAYRLEQAKLAYDVFHATKAFIIDAKEQRRA